MSEHRGRCKCGHELITIKVNWLTFIAGLIVGIYLIGVPMGRTDAVKRIQKAAPQYYKETMKARAENGKVNSTAVDR